MKILSTALSGLTVVLATVVALAASPASAITADEALAKCRVDNPGITVKVVPEGTGFQCLRDHGTLVVPPKKPVVPATAAPATAPAEPDIITVDGKEVRVWGVPPEIHLTTDYLFEGFTTKCKTLMAMAEIVTDPAIIAQHKDANTEVLFHFRCLANPPA